MFMSFGLIRCKLQDTATVISKGSPWMGEEVKSTTNKKIPYIQKYMGKSIKNLLFVSKKRDLEA